MISALWFSTVSLSPWKARYTPPTFPHSHSPKPFLYLFHTHLRAFGAQERSPLVAMTQPSSFRLILQLENAAIQHDNLLSRQEPDVTPAECDVKQDRLVGRTDYGLC